MEEPTRDHTEVRWKRGRLPAGGVGRRDFLWRCVTQSVPLVGYLVLTVWVSSKLVLFWRGFLSGLLDKKTSLSSK